LIEHYGPPSELKVSGIGENITVKIMDSQCFMNLEEANSLRGEIRLQEIERRRTCHDSGDREDQKSH